MNFRGEMNNFRGEMNISPLLQTRRGLEPRGRKRFNTSATSLATEGRGLVLVVGAGQEGVGEEVEEV